MTSQKSFESAISEESLLEKTSKGWGAWFLILDEWGAPEKGHKQTARYLGDEWDVSPWWAQTVSVRYEQERGLRQVGQRSDGMFGISLQRTLHAAPEEAYHAWTDAVALSEWFASSPEVDLLVGGRYSTGTGDQGEYRTLEPPERIRFTWDNPDLCPGSQVEVTFTPKPGGKVTVRLEHTRIPDQADYQVMKKRWTQAFGALKAFLEA